MNIGIILSRIRTDEKRLIAAAKTRGLVVAPIDNTSVFFDLEHPNLEIDILLDRCVDRHRAIYALKIAEDWGIPTLNTHVVAETSGNRLLAEMALREHRVPTPAVRVAFTPESALEAMEEVGYPVVLKPVEGPSGQLISRIQDKFTAQTVLEHKKVLGTYHHSIFFIQKYIEMPGHDVRAYVVGDRTVAAISVLTNHWVTSIKDGGLIEAYPVSDELNETAVKAVGAVGGGVLAVDLVRTRDHWQVVDLSPSTGLTEVEDITGVKIAGLVIDHAISQSKAMKGKGASS